MKKFLLFLLSPALLFAQDCKFKKNEVDAFTKNKIVQTNQRIIYTELSRSLSLDFQWNGTATINFEYESSSAKVREIIAKNNILFLLKDGSVLTYNIGSDIVTKRSAGLGMGTTLNKYPFTIDIPVSDLKKLLEIKIDQIRIETTTDPVDLKINDKKGAKIYEILQCFINEIPKE